MFTLDYISGFNNSMVAISITFTILIIIALLLSWFSIRVYRSFFSNALESLVFLNLIILSTAKTNGADSFELTFSLIGMIFAVLIGSILYQFYFIYISKSGLWQKFASSLQLKRRKLLKNDNVNERAPLINKPTSTVVGLREPVMECVTDYD